jgi:hypothetical protein
MLARQLPNDAPISPAAFEKCALNVSPYKPCRVSPYNPFNLIVSENPF